MEASRPPLPHLLHPPPPQNQWTVSTFTNATSTLAAPTDYSAHGGIEISRTIFIDLTNALSALAARTNAAQAIHSRTYGGGIEIPTTIFIDLTNAPSALEALTNAARAFHSQTYSARGIEPQWRIFESNSERLRLWYPGAAVTEKEWNRSRPPDKAVLARAPNSGGVASLPNELFNQVVNYFGDLGAWKEELVRKINGEWRITQPSIFLFKDLRVYASQMYLGGVQKEFDIDFDLTQTRGDGIEKYLLEYALVHMQLRTIFDKQADTRAEWPYETVHTKIAKTPNN